MGLSVQNSVRITYFRRACFTQNVTCHLFTLAIHWPSPDSEVETHRLSSGPNCSNEYTVALPTLQCRGDNGVSTWDMRIVYKTLGGRLRGEFTLKGYNITFGLEESKV
jgi:hypothetical protein